MKKLLLMALLCCSPLANATWYESVGRSEIIDGETEVSRNMAVQDALRQAMLYAGANVSSLQQLNGGLLQQQQLRIQSQGVIHDLQLIDEREKDNFLYVTIRADIVKDPSQCHAGQSPKSIAITHFPFHLRQQATTGAIYALTEQVPQRIYQQMNTFGANLVAMQMLDNVGQWQQISTPATGQGTTNPVQWLSPLTNAQYVLTGELRDVSLDTPQSRWMGLVSDDPRRNFTLHLSLYQRHNGELVWQKQYATSAPWELPIRQHVDVTANEFWRSSYGTAIHSLSQQALSDINDALACQTSTGEIIAVNQNNVTINLGRIHGMQKGDTLKILHQSSFSDPSGNIRQQIAISEYQLVVADVQQYHLVARPIGEFIDSSIQIRDLVVKE